MTNNKRPPWPVSAPVHCGSIRQTATILTMNRDCLRTGDKALVHFRFIKTPEYLHVEQRLVFREGRTKAVGTISKVSQGSLGCQRRGGRHSWPWMGQDRRMRLCICRYGRLVT